MKSIREALRKVDAVYDYPNYPDRYTVVMRNGEIFTMSENPLSSRGVNKYIGEIDDFPCVRNGKRVPKDTLPIEVRRAIRVRAME